MPYLTINKLRILSRERNTDGYQNISKQLENLFAASSVLKPAPRCKKAVLNSRYKKTVSTPRPKKPPSTRRPKKSVSTSGNTDEIEKKM